MADTLANVRRRVRLLSDDMDPNHYAMDSDRLNTVIESRMHLMAQECGMGATWVTGAVTLTAGDFTYTLPTTVEYQRVMAVRLNSQTWLMERITHTELLALQDGAGDAQGDPTHYAFYEDTSQQVNIWVYPTPNASDTLDIQRAAVPSALSTDATNIPFSAPLLRALEKSAAMDAILLMDADEQARRKVTLQQAPKWEREVLRAMKLEKVRFGNLRRSDVVPQKWV